MLVILRANYVRSIEIEAPGNLSDEELSDWGLKQAEVYQTVHDELEFQFGTLVVGDKRIDF